MKFLRKQYTFYYSTIEFREAIRSLVYSVMVLVGIPIKRLAGQKLSQIFLKDYSASACFLYSSARSALFALSKSLNGTAQDEVLVTGFTCEVVPHAVIQANLKPIFVDINPKTFCMNVEDAKRKITKRTRAIIIQHTFGIAADIKKLLALVREHSLFVIEDCAVALGTQYEGQLVGSFGDAAIFSFELSKTITACRGGLLLINPSGAFMVQKHNSFYEKVPKQSKRYTAQLLFQLGLSGILYRPYFYGVLSALVMLLFKLKIFKPSTSNEEKIAQLPRDYCLKLSDPQADLSMRQYLRLPLIIEHSMKIAAYYYNELKIVSYLLSPVIDKTRINFIRYPLLVKNREALVRQFNQCGFELGLWFTAPLSSRSVDHMLFGYQWGECPIAESISKYTVNLAVNGRIREAEAMKMLNLMIDDILNDSEFNELAN
jgi:dTDP-4-amino-4,6-dideoxygalactose transaminase